MKKTFLLKNIPLLLLGSALLITVAFAQTTGSKQKATATDTIPTKQKKIRDLDEALAEIDRGEAEMQKAMKEVDREKIEAEIRKAMKETEISMVKMKEDMAKAMKDFDKQKVELEIQNALKEVQNEKIIKEIEKEKIKAEVQEALAEVKKVDMEKVKAEVDKIKEVDLQKMKEELARIQPEVEKAMREAKVDIEKARKEVTAYRNLVNALDGDGLLNKKENYTIAYKAGELTVNGKKLSAEATKKYSDYLNGKKDFTLKKDEDGLNIDND